jgi:hypothetical protein
VTKQAIPTQCIRCSMTAAATFTHRDSVLPCATLAIRREAIFTSAANSLVPTWGGGGQKKAN